MVLAHELEPVSDPVTALAALAAEVVALKDALRATVADLQGITCSGRDGSRQICPEVAAYERALERAARVLTDMARLGLEERFVRVSTTQGERIVEVIIGALAELGISPDDQAVRLAVAARLRPAANAIPIATASAAPGHG